MYHGADHDAFGDRFIDYFGRFLSEVTDWEQREYFALL